VLDVQNEQVEDPIYTLQCVAVCCRVLRCVAACCGALIVVQNEQVEDPIYMCCGVLQCVALHCSVLQCVAVRSSSFRMHRIHRSNVSRRDVTRKYARHDSFHDSFIRET